VTQRFVQSISATRPAHKHASNGLLAASRLSMVRDLLYAALHCDEDVLLRSFLLLTCQSREHHRVSARQGGKRLLAQDSLWQEGEPGRRTSYSLCALDSRIFVFGECLEPQLWTVTFRYPNVKAMMLLATSAPQLQVSSQLFSVMLPICMMNWFLQRVKLATNLCVGVRHPYSVRQLL
jgi:hypothetical protein